jgi:hypothetical protein
VAQQHRLDVTHQPEILMMHWEQQQQPMLVAFQLYLQVMAVLQVMVVPVPKQEHGRQEMLAAILLLHHAL